MTIINLRTADGFTLHDNYYQAPEGMPVERAFQIARECLEKSLTWDSFESKLANRGIVATYNPVTVPTIDIEF
jgi:hypothetical protein